MRGFLLIEIIIGLAVILITLLLFGAIVSTIPLTQTARDQNLAYHVAAKKMEELRTVQYDSLPVSGPFSDPALANIPSASASIAISDYEGSVDIKQVQTQVDWIDNGRARSAVLTTLISRYGFNQ